MSEDKKALMRRMTLNIWLSGALSAEDHYDLNELFACLIATDDPEEIDSIGRTFDEIMRQEPIIVMSLDESLAISRARRNPPEGGER